MPQISLTTFVDYVNTVGTPRMTVVKNAKTMYGRGYSPEIDFWRGLRNRIIKMHTKGRDKSDLDSLTRHLKDKKKAVRYPLAIRGYKRWLGKKEIRWFSPKSLLWEEDDLEVKVNPELGLTINGKKYLIKLYFKGKDLAKKRADTMLCLMEQTVCQECVGAIPAIVDVQKGKLLAPTRAIPDINVLLVGEAAGFCAMWRRL